MLPFGSVTSTRESLLPSVSLSKRFCLSAHLFYIRTIPTVHLSFTRYDNFIIAQSIPSIRVSLYLILSSLLSRFFVSLTTLNTLLHALCHIASYPSMKWGLIRWLGDDKGWFPDTSLWARSLHCLCFGKMLWPFSGQRWFRSSPWRRSEHSMDPLSYVF